MRFPEALHCVHKHLSTARKGVEETLAKLYKECDEVCKPSTATREEAQEVVSDLNKAEAHLAECLAKSKTELPELRRFYAEVREVRKKLYQTNVPYVGEFEVVPTAVGTFEQAHSRLAELLSELGRIGAEKYEELREIECPKCEEEVEKTISKIEAAVKEEVEKSGKSATNSYKGNNPHNPQMSVSKFFDPIVRPGAEWADIPVDQASSAIVMEILAHVSEIPFDFLLTRLGAKIVKGLLGWTVAIAGTKLAEGRG